MESPPSSSPMKTIHAKEASEPYNEQRKRKLCSLPVRIGCEILVVVLVFTIATGFFIGWPAASKYVTKIVVEKTRLAPDSPGFEGWLTPPVKTIRAYRLFNITNYKDIMIKPDTTLEFQETKPLNYRLYAKKNNPVWHEDNNKLNYSLERIFIRDGQFDEELINQSGAFIDILRVMLRAGFLRVPSPSFFDLGGNEAFNYSRAIDKLEGFVSPVFGAIAAKMRGPNTDKYGFIYRYNGSNGFNYTIRSGKDDLSIRGQLINFASEYTDFSTSADQWQTDIFDGVTFPAVGNPPTRKVINIFQPDFCRPVQLRYNQTISKFGYKQVHEYVLKLVDYEKCPEMDENCPEVDRIDITRCLSSELPAETVVITKPHMYGHDSSYTNIEFQPDAEKHESKIYFEAVSGSPVRAQTRVQMNTNTFIDRIKYDDDGTSEPAGGRGTRRFIPMLWIEQSITLNPETEATLQRVLTWSDRLERAHRTLTIVKILVVFLCVVGVIVALELFLWNRRRKRYEITLYVPNEPEKTPLNRSTTAATANA